MKGAPPPQIARLPKISQNNGSKMCEFILVIVFLPLLNEGNALSFGDDLSKGSIKKSTLI